MDTFYVLIFAYLAGAFTFFMYMFLSVGPQKSTALVKKLLTDAEFVKETSRIWRDLLVAQIKAETIPLIISGITTEIASVVTLDDASITNLKKQLSEAVGKQWNMWFARQTKEVQRQEGEEMKDSSEVAQYITMNADKPDAISAISTAISAKSPILGAALQYLSQQQGPQRRTENDSKGGY